MEPSLSIIIPTLNEKHYIGRLLDSIVHQQTHEVFEVIVVDGKSQDSTITVAQAYISRVNNLRVLVSAKRGISYQRNYGAKRSHGQILLFLDADTVLPKYFITNLMSRLPKTNYFVGTCFPLLNDLNFEILLLSIISYPIGILLSRIHKMTLGYCTVASREIHELIGGYDENIFYAEDTEYGRRALAHGAMFKYYWIPPIHFSVRRLAQTGAIPWLITKFKESFVQKGIADNKNRNYEFGIFNSKK